MRPSSPILFQSTLPVWGATCMSWTRCTTQAYFNPHSPYGERPRRPSRTVRMRYFNPRSPWGERLLNFHIVLLQNLFQSTLPVWGATPSFRQSRLRCVISIHAPRVGSDGASVWQVCPAAYFNPRSPCGERPGGWKYTAAAVISIHAPRVGSDRTGSTSAAGTISFQSTLPVWGATLGGNRVPVNISISIHAPRVGSDGRPPRPAPPARHFNPRSPCGERRKHDR